MMMMQWRLQWRNSMPQFLEVVRQHILGVVGNVILSFVAYLTGFPTVKEFWKSVKI